MADPTPSTTLWEQARAYTNGRLSPTEAAAFEAHLGENQEARDALVAAVQEQHGPDADVLRPNPGYRAEVRHRLMPPPLWSRLRNWTRSGLPRAAWALAGGTLIVLLLMTAWSTVETANNPSAETPVVQPKTNRPPPELPGQSPPVATKTIPWQERGKDHLVKVPEETTRKLKTGVTQPGRETPMVP